MNARQILTTLATTQTTLPRAEFNYALAHWDDVGTELVAAFEAIVNADKIGMAGEDAGFFLVILFAIAHEKRAFPLLCQLLSERTPEEFDSVFGDLVADCLHRILVATWDGQTPLLLKVIENEDVDEFIRSTALEALAALAVKGQLPIAEVKAFLLTLFQERPAEDESFLWVSWAEMAVMLEDAELMAHVKTLHESGHVGEDVYGGYEEFLEFHKNRKSSREEEFLCLKSADTLLDELATWASFSETKTSEFDPSSEPMLNMFRHVGRNDPCPCGSGLKFKKCCLH